MAVGDSILKEQTITKKISVYVCMLINLSSYINAQIKLYEYILVNNDFLSNEDNDHEGKKKKKSQLLWMITVHIILSHLWGLWGSVKRWLWKCS